MQRIGIEFVIIRRLLAVLAVALIALPAQAQNDTVGWPYRGPQSGELGSGGDDDDEGGDDNSSETEEPADPNAGTDPNAGQSNGSGGIGPSSGKGTSIDEKILWSGWWEYNKDRFIARSTQRGRVNAGSVQYWFGSGAKYPPRDINPVTESQRRRIFDAIKARLTDKSAAVRGAACIALGRLRSIPASAKEVKEQKEGAAPVTNNMCARALLALLAKESNATVKANALLGIGMTGDAAACQLLMRRYGDLDVKSRPYALIAFGLARNANALGLVVESLPTSAGSKDNRAIAAVHALGLYGPEMREEIAKYKLKGKRNGLEQLEFLAGKTSGNDALRSQALTSLGRLQTGLKTVRKGVKNKSPAVKWSAILALSNYSGDEASAKDAAKALMKDAYKGAQQTKNFVLLMTGDLAGRLDQNSKTRTTLIKWLNDKKQLGSNDNYTRACSALALALADDQTAVTNIVAMLENTTIDHYVAGACSVSLGLLKAANKADIVVKRVVTGNKFNADARGYGLVGLALMGDTTRMETLIAASKKYKQKEVARQAPLAAGVLGDRRQIRDLTGHFSSKPNPKNRISASNAVFGLSWIRDAASVDGVIKLAGNNEPQVRGMAIIALGYIGSPDRVSSLTRCYENANFRKWFTGWRMLRHIAGIL